MTHPIRYVLNGKPRTIAAYEPTRTLLQHLRLHERKTATKEGCAEGDCGACTVALGVPNHDGGLSFSAVNACILLVTEIDGAVVVTAEGLADETGHLHPAQQAMVDLHGSQCGFCTPGFIMSLFAFERGAGEGPKPELDEVHEMLAGNLCRCTGYRPIVAAAEEIVAEGRDAGFDEVARSWRTALDGLIAESDPEPAVLAPRSLPELDALLADGSGLKLLSGGTDLGVEIAKHGRNPGTLVSLRWVDGLGGIEEREHGLSLGATVTYTEALPALERHFPAFAAMVRRIGSVQIRNLGTIGGNLCNASPIGDSAPCLLALGAELTLRSVRGRRIVPIDRFFTAYRRTALEPGEYLERIFIPYLEEGAIFRAYKLAKRFDQDISAVQGSFWLKLREGRVTQIRVAYGGMAATPSRAPGIEAALSGSDLDAAAIAKASAAVAADFKPLSDFRGSSDYRLKSAAGLIARLGAEFAQPGMATEVWQL